MALEKEFSRLIREERIPFGQYKSNKSVSKGRRKAETRSDCPTAPQTFVAKQKKEGIQFTLSMEMALRQPLLNAALP